MDALIIVSHTVNQYFLDKCLKIKEAFRNYGTLFILLENPIDLPIEYKTHFNIIRFDWESLKSMGYRTIEKSIIPGSNHLITLWFHQNNPGYEYYWSMEYDVEYTGEWSYFFKQAYSLGGDFQACHIRNFKEDPDWFWWNSIILPNGIDLNLYSVEKRVRSFNPIYRITEKALYCLRRNYRLGLSGHHEVVIPTVLKSNGFELIDYGGTGSYVKPGYEEKLYISQTRNHSLGSMSHIPFRNNSLAMLLPDKLVHPIKIK